MRIGLSSLNIFQKYNLKKVNNNNQNSSVGYMTSPLKADVFERSIKAPQEVSFEGKKRRGREATDFDVKKIKNITCPVCSQITLNLNQIEQYKVLVAHKKGKELVKALDEYGDESYWTRKEESKGKTIYRENSQDVVNVIKRLAMENQQANLRELCKIASKTFLPELAEKQLEVLNDLDIYAYNNLENKNEYFRVKKVIQNHRDRINGKASQNFKRKEFLRDLDETNIISDHKKQMDSIAKRLPSSTNDSGSFFVKYSQAKRPLEEIAGRLVANTIPTGEHLKPFAKGGANEIENYICDCNYCNELRGDTPFDIWAASITNFSENLQNYLDEVQKSIDSGFLPDKYINYPSKVIKTIDDLSDGEIKLVAPKEHRKIKARQNSEEYKTKQAQKRKEKQKELDSINEKINSLRAEMTGLYAESSRIRTKIKNTHSKEEKDRLRNQLTRTESSIAKNKEKLNSLRSKAAGIKSSLNKA